MNSIFVKSKRLAEGLEKVLPEKTEMDIQNIQSCTEKLFPEEVQSIHSAVLARKMEFRAGRSCARNAMFKLGIHPCPIPAKSSREPDWPSNVSGSISHDAGLAVAVVAEKENISNIGIDIAQHRVFEEGINRLICTKHELSKIHCLEASELPSHPQVLIFSMKEALFKCIYALNKRVFEFHAVEVNFNFINKSAKFRRLDRSLLPINFDQINGKYLVCDGIVLSVVWIE